MEHHRPIFLLLIAALFLTSSMDQKKFSNNTTGTIITADTAIYKVKFSFTGYQSFQGESTDCPVRTNGTVVLTGLLKGIENMGRSDDNVFYAGILQLDMDIDICSAKGEGDNAKLCNITVTGSGLVKTELEIEYDGRGGYIKITDTTSQGFRKNATGTCELPEIAEERQMIPLKTIASIFNGMDLPMLTHRTLREEQPQSIRIAGGTLMVHIIQKVR